MGASGFTRSPNMSAEGQMQHCFTAFDQDWIVSYDYRVTAQGCEARLSGPPEDCYPAEPMEYEITVCSLRRDVPEPKLSHWADQGAAQRRVDAWKAETAPVEIPEWLRDTLEQMLVDSDAVYSDLQDAEDGYVPSRRRA